MARMIIIFLAAAGEIFYDQDLIWGPWGLSVMIFV